MGNESVTNRQSLLASYQPEPEENLSRPEPLVCSAPPTPREAAARGAKPIEAEIPLTRTKTASVDVRAVAAATASTDTNAQRTSGRALGPYVETGTTTSGHTIYAAGALLKGKTPDGKIELEVGSVSEQLGTQIEYQAAALRATQVLPSGETRSSELLTARAGIGIHNSDGSTGFNVGATLIAGSIEQTGTQVGPFKFTGGLSEGAGASASFGIKDGDDHRKHVMFHAEFGPVSVGIDGKMDNYKGIYE